MQQLLSDIQAGFEAFLKDAFMQNEKGNKAAGSRARRASLKLEPLLKKFRKLSLEKSNAGNVHDNEAEE